MKKQQLITIFEDFGYSNITDEFIEIPDIKRIQLDCENTVHVERYGKCKYYFDIDSELLYVSNFDQGSELGISAIIAIDHIVSLETSNPYSMVPFTGEY